MIEFVVDKWLVFIDVGDIVIVPASTFAGILSVASVVSSMVPAVA